jgi:putative peptidoglycan lipid II flippase
MNENSRVTHAAGIVGAATTVSRILGYFRDMTIAGVFGAGPLTDVFIAAFRIPNLMRRLFGEGTLSIAFVPVFTEVHALQGRQTALRFAGSAVRFLAVALALVVLAGIFGAPWIARSLAYGFSADPDKMALTVSLTRIMMPYVFFIGLTALFMGILNVLGYFATPALSPALLNLCMIGSVVLAFRLTTDAVQWTYALALGVVAGGFLQLGLQLPAAIRSGLNLRRSERPLHPGLKKVAAMLVPATFGAAALQINTLVGNLLASFQPEGSISYLYFADRLVQFPLGIFGIATATAVLPSLSRQAAAGDRSALSQTFAYSLNLVLFITLPAMVGLIVLREPIVALLFQRGAFTNEATQLTAAALLYYALGLWAFAAVRIVAAALYALQNVRAPVRCALISVAVNLLLGLALMGPMGHCGLALALSLSATVNLALLMMALRTKLGKLGGGIIVASTVRTLISSILMGIAVWLVYRQTIGGAAPAADIAAWGTALGVLTGLAAYTLLAYVAKSPELDQICSLLRRRIVRS